MGLGKGVYLAAGLLGAPAALPFFLLHPRGRKRIRERYGDWRLAGREVLWFHGASVGEMAGLVPLMRGCRERFPQSPILATAVSPTGLEYAAPHADHVRLLPFDHPLWLGRALRGLKFKAFIFGETELWPVLIEKLSEAGVPLFLVNGRLSEFSLKRYALIRPWVARTLARLSAVCAINPKYRERFIEFGADPARVVATGNAKNDIVPSVKTKEQAADFRRSFFETERPVLVLGSLRPGEEEVWFPALNGFRGGPPLNVVAAPRHQEKFDYFAAKLKAAGLPFVRRSEQKGGAGAAAPSAPAVVLLDTLGELEAVYSFADLAFIGGSLVPGIGGHNPLEAAAYGAPVALGPHCQNIDDIVEQLREKSAYFLVRHGEDAGALTARLCAGDEKLRAAGKRAQAVWRASCGAGQRILEVIFRGLEETS